jgi:hypothetical protein
MWIAELTKLYRGRLAEVGIVDPKAGKGGLYNALGLLDQINQFVLNMQLNKGRYPLNLHNWGKVNRWLGIVQGTLLAYELYTLNDIRVHMDQVRNQGKEEGL